MHLHSQCTFKCLGDCLSNPPSQGANSPDKLLFSSIVSCLCWACIHRERPKRAALVATFSTVLWYSLRPSYGIRIPLSRIARSNWSVFGSKRQRRIYNASLWPALRTLLRVYPKPASSCWKDMLVPELTSRPDSPHRRWWDRNWSLPKLILCIATDPRVHCGLT